MHVPAPSLALPSESTTPVLASATNVAKSFGQVKALDGLSLSIKAGEAVGLLGPNGAGKSTLISLLCGLRRPDAGSVELFGRNPLEPKARLQLGITPQATSVPQTLKLRETVDFVAAHYPDPIPTAELLDRFGLAEMAEKQCGALSGGQQRRLLVALALAGRPRLVILDEPTTGLDVDARETLWRQLKDYRAQGGTLLITSHYLEEIQALASRVVVVDRGTVIADGTVDQIRSHVAISKVTFQSPLPPSYFDGWPHTVRTAASASGATIIVSQDADSTREAAGGGGRRLQRTRSPCRHARGSLRGPDPPFRCSCRNREGTSMSTLAQSTPAHPAPTAPSPGRPAPTQAALVRAHSKAQILEQLRIPVAVISSTIFPTLALLFFVIPQEAVTSHPTAALTAIAQLALFGVMSSFLFNYGIGIAEERANPWSSYLRTLPVGPVPPTIARALPAMLFAFFALLPVLVIGALLTSAPDAFGDGGLSWWRVPMAVLVWLLCGLPFLALGLFIGYLCTSKVAVAVTQVVFFPLAFAGGMMLPPAAFPDWLNTLSLFLPSRAARDIAVFALTGEGLHASSILCLAAWTLLLGGLALWANRRDQGRRFR
ncbi:ABC transporter [Arthrobacter crystallopoietes BAB-32]|uniref:ABC transporter n=1 Tax=Arthrobacter crystallopoietes BAB-32 TaxID=1246476 RepID=N1UPL1_9MICC|nr:ATP-binding cassette domain-containing protein [Arthrobacter crystallopoietes]EMY32341.1 ABC transporter [Arthrobacter crystallopoietes BAB-32]